MAFDQVGEPRPAERSKRGPGSLFEKRTSRGGECRHMRNGRHSS
jgi:hypothetical protein